ncbi:hypothetical protein GDO81_007109 [Engystomops pustulosus]|uniref:Metalloendopeptidase n=1 Tax=Engystomops pustulosus TaxID=76066 RepID=A0AAV7C5W7_ENGPU|nr:hypothetical protein GDO81_007109 [Engystomops pustulosus]
MEVIRLSLFLYLAAQALSRPTYESTSEYDGEAALDRTVFGVIEAANKNNTLLKEGDIADELSRSARRCTTCMWKKSKGIVKVPFTIAPDQYSPSTVSLIHDALKEFEVMTCVQFVNRSTESDFLYIKSGAGCWSYIGRTMGQQVLSLANTSCMVYGVIQHEAMHNLGFFHEHTRIDRDNYINILWENIAKDISRNIITLSPSLQGYKGTFDINDRNTLNLPYDYNSVMHYPK